MVVLVTVVDGMVIIVDGLALHVASVVRSAPFSLAAVNISVVPFASLTVFPDVHDGKWQWTVAVLLTAPAKETFVAVIIAVLDTLVTDSALTSYIRIGATPGCA